MNGEPYPATLGIQRKPASFLFQATVGLLATQRWGVLVADQRSVSEGTAIGLGDESEPPKWRELLSNLVYGGLVMRPLYCPR